MTGLELILVAFLINEGYEYVTAPEPIKWCQLEVVTETVKYNEVVDCTTIPHYNETGGK